MFFRDLIKARIKALELSRREFIGRLGYHNIAKGERRLRALEAGDLALARTLKDAIASATELPLEAVEAAIAAEWNHRTQLDDAAYRRGFVPHAILRTTQSRPSPITIAAIIQAEQMRYLWLPAELPVVQYASHVAGSLPEGVPCFGLVTGFVLNYSPDRAVEFDREGNPMRELDRAVRIGRAEAFLSGRPMPRGVIP